MKIPVKLLMFFMISTAVWFTGCDVNTILPASDDLSGGKSAALFKINAGSDSPFAYIADSASLLISAEDMDDFYYKLEVTDSTVEGTATGIPSGSDRLFTISVYDSLDSLQYQGTATADLPRGATVNVSITVYRVGSSAVINGNIVEAGDTLTSDLDVFPTMVLIPACDHSFIMGSETYSDAMVHEVVFTYNYYIDTTEVTQKSFDSVMSSAYQNYATPEWSSVYGIGDSYPAYYINWYDAVLYCNARSKLGGYDTVYSYTSITGTPGTGCSLNGLNIDLSVKGCRLPTEAEWEYACRAGSQTDFYWGSSTEEDTVKKYAWYGKNAGGENWNWTVPHASDSGAQPVAQKAPNDFGLYDMSGNVWEWCNDWYDASYYEESPNYDPAGPDSETGHRVERGGGWYNPPSYISSAYRSNNKNGPGFINNGIGMRVVLPEEISVFWE